MRAALSDLPDAVRDLIARSFDSAEAVEIALLLRRSPETFWRPTAAARQLGIRDEFALRTVLRLAEDAILVPAERTTAFRYAPAGGLGRHIDQVAECYSTRRLAVINTIYAANLQSLRTFCDAFRFKKE